MYVTLTPMPNNVASQHAEPGHHLLTFEETAATLGVSIATVKGLMKRGELHTVRLSTRTVRVESASIAEFISRQLARQPSRAS